MSIASVLKCITPTIPTDSGSLLLANTKGSSAAFWIAAAFRKYKNNILVVVPDREQAAYLFTDLQTIISTQEVLFFPSSYKKKYHPEQVDATNTVQRSAVISRMEEEEHKSILITYPEGIYEKIVDKNILQQNKFTLTTNQVLSIDFIEEFLSTYDFEKVDFVLECGQYAIRGGIVDIFSYGYEDPFRIEFLGNTIESIRFFNINSQLSIQTIHKAVLLPNIQNKDIATSKCNLLEYLPNAMLYTDASLDILEAVEDLYQYTKEHWTAEDGSILDEHFTTKQELFTLFQKNTHWIETQKGAIQANKTLLNSKIEAQTNFNKNFELLSQELSSNTKKEYKNYIFSESETQIKRLKSILEDIGSDNDNFIPIIASLQGGFIHHDLKIACYTDHQIFNRYHKYKVKRQEKTEQISLKDLLALKPGDLVTHIDHGIGRFSGLQVIDTNGKKQEVIRIIYKDNDILYVSVHALHKIARYNARDGDAVKLHKLGSNAWNNLKNKTKGKLKDIAEDLIRLYASRKSQIGFAFTPDTYLQHELEASFMYEDTPDQLKSTIAVKKDMEKSYPMDRLVCGDVGFGKTEIAIRAAFKAVADSKQVAVLVPTTILALQHYKTFVQRLKELPCNVDYINRFKTAKQQKETLQKLKEGKIDILIGTHRIISKDVIFKDLGLLIIDEEQKFGVAAKEKLRYMRQNIDTLTLTATPIPRTLQFSMLGARDLSVIHTPPPNRQPINTELHSFNTTVIQEAINFELARNGQVFFVNNRIQNLPEIVDSIRKLCPIAEVQYAHGQMEAQELESLIMDFVEGKFDVLVSTTIIEAGLDIPNANTIIINDAQNFGMSDLHQLRGRVGRSNKKAFCYFLVPSMTVLTEDARKRLQALEEFSELGSGFQIAMKDLDIRGAGNLLGGEQSGFIAEMGFETYQKILEEAIQELKENEYQHLYQEDKSQDIKGATKDTLLKTHTKDCILETDLEVLIPNHLITNSAERLLLYKELDDVQNETELEQLEIELKDKFGKLPLPMQELLFAIRVRWKGRLLGFEKMVLKKNTLIAYFVFDPQSKYYQTPIFQKIMKYVSQKGTTMKIKEGNQKLYLSITSTTSLEHTNQLLTQMLDYCTKQDEIITIL